MQFDEPTPWNVSTGTSLDGSRKLRFVCISDTHMRHGALKIPEGDVLVHTGDFTNFGTLDEVKRFADWFASHPHPTKLVVPGNHDMIFEEEYWKLYWADWTSTFTPTQLAFEALAARGIRVLVDEALELDHGVTVFGSPWVTKYAPWRTAFNRSEAEMALMWAEAAPGGSASHVVRPPAGGVDVLLTHMPPRGIGDMEGNGDHTGCEHLLGYTSRAQPQFHVFGHVHTDWGANVPDPSAPPGGKTTFVNAASVSDYYRTGPRCPIVFDCGHR